MCRKADGYVHERWRWEVRLNNGEVVYRDDYRPGVAEPMAWRRLKAYCRLHGLFITRMVLRFRSHLETPLPNNQNGYFFVHNAFSVAGLTGNLRDGVSSTLDYCVLGFVDRVDGKLRVQRWKVPEIIRAPFLDGSLEEVRPIEPEHPGIILKQS